MGREITITKVVDPVAKDNFSATKDFINTSNILAGQFKYMEIEVNKAVTNQQFGHSLGFIPKDIIQTYISDPSMTVSGSNVIQPITYNYTAFTDRYISITTTKAIKVRLLVGKLNKSDVRLI